MPFDVIKLSSFEITVTNFITAGDFTHTRNLRISGSVVF